MNGSLFELVSNYFDIKETAGEQLFNAKDFKKYMASVRRAINNKLRKEKQEIKKSEKKVPKSSINGKAFNILAVLWCIYSINEEEKIKCDKTAFDIIYTYAERLINRIDILQRVSFLPDDIITSKDAILSMLYDYDFISKEDDILKLKEKGDQLIKDLVELYGWSK